MKKVMIIGAGIAGLTSGIYSQLNGFETEIVESHTIPGGECTGWDRGEYHFDGCIHWMMGSKEGVPLHKVWLDTGALDDSVRIINHDIYTRYEDEQGIIDLYTNADKLQKHLQEIAPEDAKEIKNMCSAIHKMAGFTMPTEKPMDMMTAKDGITFMFKNMGGMSRVSRYSKMTMREFAERFTNTRLRNLFRSLLPERYTSMALLSMLAGMNSGDCGYPEGGSRAVAKRMEQKFISLGGKITYRAKVDKILVDNGVAKGIKFEDGRELFADTVISCADGYATLVNMLEDKYTPENYRALFNQPAKFPTITSSLVFLGIDAELMKDIHGMVLKREKPLELNGVETDYWTYISYATDKNMAPKGKTVISCYYDADYEYWKNLSEDKEKYKAEKKRLECDAISALIKKFPEIEGKIEITDVVTPLTYERYCNAWRGSWMTWVNNTNTKEVPRYATGLLTGLEHFIMAGMWTLPPGGLPGAAAAGKFAAQRLCMQNGTEFKTM
ncbi:MAG: NAD(P)/FAD-dependent oxidoreductase [Eubacteriales bacterium]